MDETNQFASVESSSIDLMGVPLPGKDHWFFTPPPFFFGFQVGDSWLGMGVEVQPGGYRFTEYGYHGRRGAFHLSLAFDGNTSVNGKYRLPAIGFDFAEDPYQAMQLHVQALQIKPREPDIRPVWWYEPIFCGWGAQCSLAAASHTGNSQDYSRQFLYEKFLCTWKNWASAPGWWYWMTSGKLPMQATR